jgi:diketogulonate reductase-like aldo/keto reductase
MEFTLNDGRKIPAVGLGTWQATDDEGYNAVKHALSIGYRHIDTAVGYGNEADVGRGLADSDVPREEVFITTKITNAAWTTEAAAQQIRESLERLGTDYIDLLLIHWPGSAERNIAVYRAMEMAVDQGTVRSLGISNFNIHHINDLLSEVKITPAVNQMECHISLQNTRLHAYLQERGILLEAYAPLKSSKVSEVVENPTLKEIGSAHGKSATQVALRWLVQRGIVALPKSVTPSRIEQNFGIFDFELADEEMKEIRKLNKAERLFPEPDNVDFGFVVFD